MSFAEPDFAQILAAYSGDYRLKRSCRRIISGFSGSKIWRLETAAGPLCLRCWPPESPDINRLRYIHSVLAEVAAAGFRQIPQPIPALDGVTFVEKFDHHWELSPWLPGEPDRPDRLDHSSSAVRIQAACSALAAFHRAAHRAEGFQSLGSAPGLLARIEHLRTLLAGGIHELCRQIERHQARWPDLAQRSQPFIGLFVRAAPDVLRRITALAALQVPIQSCIRDVHRDHILFVDDAVTGIVDFGSMKPDSVASDIARLLGSMAIDHAHLWEEGLAIYSQIRSLSADERRLIRAYDQSAVLLSGIHWLQWLFAEGRRFERPAAVLHRFDVMMQRLARLAA
ncbi:MAG: phosphotransferase [Pirellulales bacterium]|nr:phosphotransferase [Pirellulales bacterium]